MSEKISKTVADQIIGLRHAGYIVDDLDQAIAGWQRIYGVTGESVQVIEAGETRFAFIRIADSYIELIQPVSGDTAEAARSAPVGGAGINHLAWTVRDLDQSLALLAGAGIKPGYVTPDGPMDTGYSRLVYLDPDTTGGHYIELVEDK